MTDDHDQELKNQIGVARFFLAAILLCVVVGIAFSLPIVIKWTYRQYQFGEQFDQQLFDGPRFAVRVTAFRERGTVLADTGALYEYEVRTDSDWWWRKIIVIQRSNVKPISREQFIRINERNACFYQGSILAVTTNSGENWSIKGGLEHPPIIGNQTDLRDDVEQLEIGSDGIGTMQLSQYDYKTCSRFPTHFLVTSDYGLSWRKQEEK